MSPVARSRSDQARPVDRLMREVKESPTKAIALSLGALVALWVWIPRLLPAADSGAAAPYAGLPSESWNDFESRSEPYPRDSLAIRSEFIAISEEARRVRRFADPWLGERSSRDPFDRPDDEPVITTAEPTAEEAAESLERAEREARDVVAEAAAAEIARANALELRGVFEFGKDKSALLGGRIVRVGDRIDGLRIVAIDARAITLRGEHGDYERRLKDPLAREDDRQEERG